MQRYGPCEVLVHEICTTHDLFAEEWILAFGYQWQSESGRNLLQLSYGDLSAHTKYICKRLIVKSAKHPPSTY